MLTLQNSLDGQMKLAGILGSHSQPSRSTQPSSQLDNFSNLKTVKSSRKSNLLGVKKLYKNTKKQKLIKLDTSMDIRKYLGSCNKIAEKTKFTADTSLK